ncbi:BTAD domain-containing putative transcriptional regulator [Saccharothrix sp.]|uniref:BTAD domain-containing putative transcriptional regulator n=1 Tax=Saccharothrix sp. TaxID=1873460 RepID=UPI002811200B|nr:BTAD domain-containing putative transcriptional regulator [Saccharothrix sp.]
MRFGVLGPVVAWRADGSEVRVGGAGLRALLARLAVDAGRVVGVDRLVDALYGERPPAGVANAVQSQVSRLRSVLDVGIERSSAGYRLAVDPWDVDALRFEELVARGLSGEALALWRGPALADVGDAPFAGVVAARWEELRLKVVEDHDVASVAVLRELVAAHPLRERLVARLVRALHGEGRQAEALALVDRTRRVLAEELGADPSPELAAAHGEVLRGERPAGRHVLPAQLTSFVGRAEEVRLVGKALDEARLVTLLGPGGAGKTRLAVEVAAGRPGDVFFVDLAPLGAGGDVPQAVVTALGLREDGLRAPRAARERLVAALAGRDVLLVLDNCEHVVEDAAALAGALLVACPGLRVLATSREVLGVTGETVRPVPPLPAVDGSSPAVALFADRAVAVDPSFRLDAETVPLVVAICRALDGMPLAIELAAARVRSLPPAEVAARLDDRFRLLSRGNRAAAPRHRTLHAVVEWSWDLLSEPERVVARRLTVFADGATLESAAAVCGVDGVDEVLPSLADKSLVEVSGGRYRMLDTIRAFGAARLAEAGEVEAVRRAHAEWFLRVAVRATPHLLRGEQLEWLAALADEHENFKSAIRWAAGCAVEPALRLVAELGWYFWLRGLRTEGSVLAAEVMRAVGPVAPAGLTEEYLLCALAASSVGEVVPGALSPRQDVPEGFTGPPTRPFLTMMWGMAYGVPDLGEPTLDARRGHLVGTDPWSRSLALAGLGMQYQYAGRLGEAREAHESALAGFRALGERWGMSMVLAQLAELSRATGDLSSALVFLDEALALGEQFGTTEHTANMLAQRAEWRCHRGSFDAAWADLERAAVMARSQGAVETLAGVRLGMAEVARHRGDLAGARAWCEEALRVCPRGWFGPEEVRAHIHVAVGRLELAGGDVAAARAVWGLVVASAAEWGNPMVLAKVAEAWAQSCLEEGDAAGAAELLGAARGLRGTVALVDPDVLGAERAASAALGAEGFAAASGRGAAMGRDGLLAALRG